MIFKQVLSRGAPPAGQSFEKRHLLKNLCGFPNLFVMRKYWFSRGAASGRPEFRKIISSRSLMVFPIILRFSSRDLARVLPPAGQNFEKWYFLENVDGFLNYFAIFKQGFSRGAASGGPESWKMTPSSESWWFSDLLLKFSGIDLAVWVPPAG